MKTLKLYVLLVLLTITSRGFAQTFQVNIVADTFDLENTQAEWADLNNDGHIDLFFAGISNGHAVSHLFVNQGQGIFDARIIDVPGWSTFDYEIEDIDNDNDLDLILGGALTSGEEILTIYLNNGDLSFSPLSTPIDSIQTQTIDIEDLDNDGKKEIVISGVDLNDSLTLNIYTSSSNAWEVGNDELATVSNAHFLFFDYDLDGQKDILLQGEDDSNQDVVFIYLNQGDLEFEESAINIEALSQANASFGDVNSDGLVDVLVSGVNASDSVFTQLYLTEADSLMPATLPLTGVYGGELLIADFNSDGFSDLFVNGKGNQGESISQLYLNQNDSSFLRNDSIFNKLSLDQIAFGDYDYDGDIDMASWTGDGTDFQLSIIENTTSRINLGPSAPTNPRAFVTADNDVYIFWTPSGDDHTNIESLTFDLLIGQGNTEVVAPAFDAANLVRTLTKHGNVGYADSALVKGLAPGVYDYAIQSVDNSFYAAGPGIGVCRNQFVVCGSPNLTVLEACPNEEVVLTDGTLREWFSAVRGYLGSFDTLKLRSNATDTVYTNIPGNVDCALTAAWAINIEGLPLELGNDTTICKGDVIEFRIDADHTQIKWFLNDTLDLENNHVLPVELNQHTSIRVEARNRLGCLVSDSVRVTVSEPELQLGSNTLKIVRGDRIQLSANGTQFYQWKPAESLNRDDISNPLAQPETTTEYTVVGTDSVGCSATATVLVVVVDAAFIPTLFTPNRDGKNDMLRVYGLLNAVSFQLRIVDRSGNLVYETQDVVEATNTGWDGTRNGTPQPNGIYYWKVQGEFADGSPVSLNGKASGAIHLMR
ncbi:MAG: FG-GAP-like repeat-containing protein [Bacteroidota bacterium]